MGHRLLHNRPAVPGGHRAPVLRDNEQIEEIAPGGRLLNQVQVAQGHGVTVHHRRAGGPSGSRGADGLRPCGKAAPAVLHQHGLLRPRHLLEPQAGELRAVFRFCVEEQPPPAKLHSLPAQGGEYRSGQALALVGGVHGDALDDVPLQGGGSDDPLILVPHKGGVFNAGGVPQARPGQKPLQLLQGAAPQGAAQLLRAAVFHRSPSHSVVNPFS